MKSGPSPNKKSRSRSNPELLGVAIVKRGGHITKVNDRLFLVKSIHSTRIDAKAYRVNWRKNQWSCQCVKSDKRRQLCEHIHAVNFLLRLPQLMMANQNALTGGCPHCGSTSIILKGWRPNKSGAIRRFYCKKCRKKFKNPGLYEHIDANIALSIAAIDLYFRGLSVRQIAEHFRQIYGIHKSPSTLHNWVMKLTHKMRRATSNLRLPIGSRWLADEMVVNVDGKKRYLWNILDYGSRVHIVSLLLKGRGATQAGEVIEAAIVKALHKPIEVSTDGLSSYKKPLARKGIRHNSNVGLADKRNNNRIERLHGSIRTFIRAKRGLKNRATELLEGHQAFYNFIRYHSSIGSPPARKSDMKWATLFLNP